MNLRPFHYFDINLKSRKRKPTVFRYTCQSSLALTSISDDLYRIINANVKETVPELDLEESDENYIKDRDFHRKSLVQKLTKTSLSIDYTDVI